MPVKALAGEFRERVPESIAAPGLDDPVFAEKYEPAILRLLSRRGAG